MVRHSKYILSSAALIAFVPSILSAAVINWAPSTVITSAADISNPGGSTVHYAGDFNTTGGYAQGEDNIINGITFVRIDASSPGLLDSTLNNGPSYDSSYTPLNSGDGDLDALVDSHSWKSGNPTTADFTIEGLVAGRVYQVQLIAVGDQRSGSKDRLYEPDDGQGNYTTGVTLERELVQTTIGSFTADGSTQTFSIRSFDGVAGNNDPGLAGIVILDVTVPEPSMFSLLLAGLVLGSSLSRRRR